TQRTFDTNGDPLTVEYEEVATGRSEYTWGYRTVWTRTYGANGLTSTAVEVQDYGGFAFSSLLSNTYDEKDRPIRQRREENGAVELSSWVYAEGRRFDELVVSEETRDATAMVSQGVYRTFDERGRTVSETERFYADEIVTVTTWDPDRWAEVGMEVSRDGVLDQIIDVDVDDGDPWMTRTRAYDGYEGEPDGTVDAVFIETWTCP
ncbi:MAG: hypothetical protein KC656_37045, partial [Myxococcales bacterium]|nr:hypothetical protein [Myxococcales bacterium]